MRRWLAIALVGLIPAAYVAAFLAMGWIRARQGHDEQVYPSRIEALAISREPADPLADARARGEKVYRHYCQICHGEGGKGDGFNSSHLDPRPRNFSDAKFWRNTRGDRIYDAVAQGGTANGKSVLMPAWGHTLTERQLRDVMVFIRAFAAPAKSIEARVERE
ncbi:MAG: cytochrome c [Thermoguttaceae bacterium]|jgi:mono/diheme cytochrome c family protein